MIGQLTWMFGPEQVDQAIAAKLAKLQQLLVEKES
jgi:hypothetical protein